MKKLGTDEGDGLRSQPYYAVESRRAGIFSQGSSPTTQLPKGGLQTKWGNQGSSAGKQISI